MLMAERAVWYFRGSASGNNSVVECDLAKVEVAGSNPVSRSNLRSRMQARVAHRSSRSERRWASRDCLELRLASHMKVAGVLASRGNYALLSLLLPALLSRSALLSAPKLTAAFRRTAGL